MKTTPTLSIVIIRQKAQAQNTNSQPKDPGALPEARRADLSRICLEVYALTCVSQEAGDEQNDMVVHDGYPLLA